MIFDIYIDSRLREWANWIIDIKLGNLGYPKESLISKVMILGMLVRSGISKPPISHPRAEHVGYWLMRMSERYPRYSEAVALCYLNPEIPQRFLARELKVSVSTLKERVKDGKVWLSGLLTAYSESEDDDESKEMICPPESYTTPMKTEAFA